jgi:hypothetical protein
MIHFFFCCLCCLMSPACLRLTVTADPLTIVPYSISSQGQGAATASDNSTSTSLPNIVVVMVDDLGWNQVGYHANPAGNTEISTPSIDKHALEGIQVDRAYATPCK